MQIVGTALEGETDVVAKRAACLLVALLLESLGSDALTTLDATQLVTIWQRLRFVRDEAASGAGGSNRWGSMEDEPLHQLAVEALAAMRGLAESLVHGTSEAAQMAAAVAEIEGLRVGVEKEVRMPGSVKSEIEVVEREGKMKALIEEIGEGAKKVGGASIQEAEVREMEA